MNSISARSARVPVVWPTAWNLEMLLGRVVRSTRSDEGEKGK